MLLNCETRLCIVGESSWEGKMTGAEEQLRVCLTLFGNVNYMKCEEKSCDSTELQDEKGEGCRLFCAKASAGKVCRLSINPRCTEPTLLTLPD